MNIVGNGQLANVFKNSMREDSIIFASGVADSNCKDIKEFQREKELLLKNLVKYSDKKFIYFSSCALSAKDYELSPYYKHKKQMETIIKEKAQKYYIFRIPQLFGEIKQHPTLINFLFYAVKNREKFTLYDDAYRYVIEINDVKRLVEAFLAFSNPNIIIDLANNYRYSLFEIITVIEDILHEKAIFSTESKSDKYELDLSRLYEFVQKNNVNIDFGKDYLYNKLKEKIIK